MKSNTEPMSARELINKYKSRELHPFVCEKTGQEKTEEERDKRYEQLQPYMLARRLAELENNFAWRMADILLRVCPPDEYTDVTVSDVVEAIRQSGYTSYPVRYLGKLRSLAQHFPPNRRRSDPVGEDQSAEIVSRPRDLREKAPALAKVVTWAEARQREIDRVRWALGDAAVLLLWRGDGEWVAVAGEELAEWTPEEHGYPSMRELCVVAKAFPPETRRADKGWELHRQGRSPELMAEIIGYVAEDPEKQTFTRWAKLVKSNNWFMRRLDREQRDRDGK
jgi:hypothetical protein